MPKGGKNRQSGRDVTRGDRAGGLGGEQDYDWIRYLGEGQSSAAAPPSGRVSQSRASGPQAYERPRGGGAPAGRDAGVSGVAGHGGPAGPEGGGSRGRAFERGAAEPGPGGRSERSARGRRASRAEHPSWPEQQIPYAGQPRLAAQSQAPGDEQVNRVRGPGRAVKVRAGHTTDLLFNPDAEDYAQPLYPSADGQGPGDPQQDWQHGGWEGKRRLDTAEFARPLYPDYDSGPATSARPIQSWHQEDQFADADARTGLVPAERPRALPRPGERTGPRRRPGDLDRAGPTGESGIRVARGAARPPGATAEYAVADLARDSGVPSREPQVKPISAPSGPAVEQGRGPRKGGPPEPGEPRSRSRKGRARAGQPASRWRSRVPAKIRVLLGLLLVAALGVAGYAFLLPKTSHVVSAPARAGGYVRQQANATANELRQRIVAAAAGSVKNVVAADYRRSSGPGTSNGPQIIVFIGGNLAGGASADGLINAYMAGLKGAVTTNPGRLGGQAACAPGSSAGPAECAWADGDTFGVLVSATMNSATLAAQMRQMRPLAEHVVK